MKNFGLGSRPVERLEVGRSRLAFIVTDETLGVWLQATQVCAVVFGKTLSIASGKPFNPSTQAMKMSSTSRVAIPRTQSARGVSSKPSYRR